MAEVLALRDGILLASSLSLDRIILESDNLEAVQACRKEIQRGDIRAILEDIWKTKQQFEFCGFTWTSRQGNQLAHHIAAMAKEKMLPPNWTYNIPDFIKELLLQDKTEHRNDTNDNLSSLAELESS